MKNRWSVKREKEGGEGWGHLSYVCRNCSLVMFLFAFVVVLVIAAAALNAVLDIDDLDVAKYEFSQFCR